MQIVTSSTRIEVIYIPDASINKRITTERYATEGICFYLRNYWSTQPSEIPVELQMSKVIEEEEPEVVVKKNPGGFICRLEPINTDWIKQFPRSTKLIQRSRWFIFCDKLQGHHSQLTMDFIENYNDERVQLQSLTIRVNEEFIAEAISVLAQGEIWFKQKDFQSNLVSF